MLKRVGIFVGAVALVCIGMGTAHADIITFGPAPYGTPVAATVEGDFLYDTFSGGLFRDSQGSGDLFNMEGCSVCGGGVLRIVRDDVLGGLFTFDQADVAFQFNVIGNITFSGYRLGVLQGTDIFVTTGNSSYSTQLSAVLAGLSIDELRVTLPATSSTASVLDNVVLTKSAAVPEPSTLLLLGAGVLGLMIARRRES